MEGRARDKGGDGGAELDGAGLDYGWPRGMLKGMDAV